MDDKIGFVPQRFPTVFILTHLNSSLSRPCPSPWLQGCFGSTSILTALSASRPHRHERRLGGNAPFSTTNGAAKASGKSPSAGSMRKERTRMAREPLALALGCEWSNAIGGRCAAQPGKSLPEPRCGHRARTGGGKRLRGRRGVKIPRVGELKMLAESTRSKRTCISHDVKAHITGAFYWFAFFRHSCLVVPVFFFVCLIDVMLFCFMLIIDLRGGRHER